VVQVTLLKKPRAALLMVAATGLLLSWPGSAFAATVVSGQSDANESLEITPDGSPQTRYTGVHGPISRRCR